MSDRFDDLFAVPPLGIELGEQRNQLLAAVDTLADLGGGSIGKRAQAVRARIRNAALRIGVVGQIKAGKSSTINALTRRTGFLPADVNPWTTVVTRLHFGHVSGKTSGAIFRFFDDAEWDRLANRGGRLGELAEGLLEDYKREKLQEQVEAMRERAQLRLGQKFAALLGKAHRFEQVTPEVLARYVAAGDDPEPRVVNPTTGRFADITHSADIYFPQAPFGFPLSLIDTPGVNDPLLIREEITQQSIENSDHFIVVLSAHQTLSKVDMRLIRLLKALNRDRFVVFVNRLDEIRNPAAEFDRVRDKVIDNLRRELDGKDVSVVIGSAAWANFALTGNEDLLDRRTLDGFVAARGLKDQARALDPRGRLDDPARAEAYLASGMDELMRTMSDLVMTGPTAGVLVEARADLLAKARQAVERSQIRLSVTDESNAAFAPIATPTEVNHLVGQAATRTRDMEKALAETCDDAFAQIAADLDSAIARYAAEQVNVLKAAISATPRGRTVACDVDPLRAELDTIYKAGFQELQKKLAGDVRMFERAIRTLMPEKVRDRIKSVSAGTTGITVLTPQTDAIYRTVSVDLVTSWFSSLFGGSTARVHAAAQSLRQQFGEIGADLVAAGRARLAETAGRIAAEYRDDLETQLRELAGITPTGEVYSLEVVQERRALREQALADLAAAETLVESLASTQNAASTGDEAA